MIWFTSDTHFNHTNIIKHASRPFSSTDEMNKVMVARWNDVVSSGDTVYHLGDFMWGRDTENLLSKLNGQKCLIKGNHDRGAIIKSSKWCMVKDYYELKVVIGERKQCIVLSHYAFRVWNKMHYGSWMLYGHSHGNLSDIGGLTLDVGVDKHNYQPVNMDQVGDYMSGRKVVTFDHHTLVNGR